MVCDLAQEDSSNSNSGTTDSEKTDDEKLADLLSPFGFIYPPQDKKREWQIKIKDECLFQGEIKDGYRGMVKKDQDGKVMKDMRGKVMKHGWGVIYNKEEKALKYGFYENGQGGSNQ